MSTTLTVLVALLILGMGFYRARPYGRLGIFSWLQSAALMAPWIVFFGLFAAGVYLNFVGILLLLVLSTAAYIILGRQVRSLAAEEFAKQAMAKMAQAESETVSETMSEAESKPTPETPTELPKPNPIVPIEAIPAEDLQAIKGIFGIDTFFVTETIPYQDGAILNGNLRGEPEQAHQKLTDALKARVGDRYRLFLIENPEGKPTMVVLPKTADPQPSTLWQKLVAVGLFFATIATCLETAGFLQGFDFYQNLHRYAEVLPIGLGIVGVLIAHELGHWVVAKRENVQLSWPFFLPTWQIGAFGALTRFESVVRDRKTLFDVAFAGPAVGGVLSLILLVLGLLLSHTGSLFHLPTVFFEGSILVGTLAKVALRESLQQAIVDVHPLVIVGWIGLLMTAINLMPAGRLDGGRIVHAIYGRKTANRTTVATLLLLVVASLVNPLALYWAILILFLQRDLERPPLNEVSEPDDARAALGLLALFLMVATLLPLTPSLAGRLGIGG
jgi:hypothetical protein